MIADTIATNYTVYILYFSRNKKNWCVVCMSSDTDAMVDRAYMGNRK